MTFDPHPLKVLTPDSAPLLLTDTIHKLQLLEQFGLDGCLLIPFNRRFSGLSAEEFLARLRHGIPTLHSLFLGHDWRFGNQGRGDIALLNTWASPLGIAVHQSPSVLRGNIPISSTRVREAVCSGRLAEATAMLGRPFSMLGTVVGGQRIGRTLGFPTANLAVRNEAHPPLGIYAAQAIVGGQAFPGVVNFGYHPTVSRVRKPVLELHLLDTRLNLYRKTIEVFFLRRLRPEKKFPDRPSLIRQIETDIRVSRRVLSAAALKKCWIRTLQEWHPDTIVPQTNK
jgi:riboflavin kinase/FMN adenylyltransferase